VCVVKFHVQQLKTMKISIEKLLDFSIIKSTKFDLASVLYVFNLFAKV